MWAICWIRLHSSELQDDADLTYNPATDTLATSKIDIGVQADLASAKVEDLTATRVVFAGTGGELVDSANLTFNGTTLTISGLAVTGGFASQGIDDNATQEILEIDDTNVLIKKSGVTLGGFSSGTKSVMDNFVVDGGTF